MKKVIMCDFAEYNSTTNKLANYHYCNCFVKDGYEVLWLSNAFNHLNYFKDKAAFRYKMSLSSVERHHLADQVYGFAPYSLWLYANYPFFRSSKILESFGKYIIPNIEESLRKLNFLDIDVLWISNPKAYYLTKVVKYNKLIYRIADDYKEFAELPNIAGIDELLIKRADNVIVASSTLEQHVIRQGKTPLVLSNGVEFEHFSKGGVARPAEYQQQERKRIVYVGALKYWLDLELIKKIAEQVEADIYLIGKCDIDLATLEQYSNVHILGNRSYDLLPGYLQYADVALIPFVKSSLTDSISPIKLYEYCAAGIAVVSTNMAETVKLKAPIWIAEDHESFIAGIRHYLFQGYNRSEMTEFARHHSWDQRYALMKKTFGVNT